MNKIINITCKVSSILLLLRHNNFGSDPLQRHEVEPF